MSLTPGARLGPYLVIASVGAGGMGEVFRARDTRLDREVAIKVLPAEFANDVQLRLRFEREARAISQLSHPNICTLFDVGDGYLVMELLEGETLAERIARGPLPVNDVLKIGAQIAGALDRAHKAGIVHRDLKPSNVMLTKSGAKLLDFGLAKEQASGLGPRATDLETEHKPLTQEGTLLGTVQYMAPEQLDGVEADARTDVFALGSVLYEMATGRRAFSGRTKASLIAAIVGGQPERISATRPLTPASLESVIGRALEKDPQDRWQCASDLRWELLRIEQEAMIPAELARRRSTVVAWLVAALALIGAAAAAYIAFRPVPAAQVSKFTFDVPPGWIVVADLKSGAPAMSPDGRRIAFVAANTISGRRVLWLRTIGKVEPKMLEATDDAGRPFFSPDGRSIAFFADNSSRLKRVEVEGGPSRVICETPYGRGGTWGAGDTIVFSSTPTSPLYRVNAGGGTPVPVTKLEAGERESSHRWPSFLPDGKHFFFAARRLNSESALVRKDRLYVSDLETGLRKPVFQADSNVLYADPGYVVFVRDGALYAQRFDARRLEVAGEPVLIVPQVESHAAGFGMFAVSRSALVYQAGSIDASLELLDRGRDRSEPLLPAAQYSVPRFSSDQHKIVYDLVDPGSGTQDVWLFDRGRKVSRRLTSNPADDFSPVLSPDGTRVYFTSNRTGTPQMYVRAVEGGEERLLQQGRGVEFVQSISPDGRYLLYVEAGASQQNVRVLSLGDGKQEDFAASAFEEMQPQFSPDGRFVAFTSNESGQYEVYVAPFPSGAPMTQISIDGGTQPSWRGDGRELYFIGTSGRLMAVPIETRPRIKAGEPSVIASVTLRPSRVQMREYDVSADGKTFLLNTTGSGRQSLPFTVVLNWTEELRK